MFTWGMDRQKWQGQWHECWGLEGRRGGKGRDERTDGKMEMSDICSRQLTTPGWPGGVRGDRGHEGADNSHKCCNGWYFKFNSLLGSECLSWFIVSFFSFFLNTKLFLLYAFVGQCWAFQQEVRIAFCFKTTFYKGQEADVPVVLIHM